METVDFLPQFAHKPALAEPGVQVRYCNVGYVLAGLALERVVGESYRTYASREVFERAGMTGAGFLRPPRRRWPGVAEGWDLVAGERGGQTSSATHRSGRRTAGPMRLLRNLFIFLDAVRAGRLLTPELTEQFLTPQVA